jgi:membrane-associated protease RseP (regulator of RpoE activity)
MRTSHVGTSYFDGCQLSVSGGAAPATPGTIAPACLFAKLTLRCCLFPCVAITSLTPNTGPVAGGTLVTVAGTSLSSGTSVTGATLANIAATVVSQTATRVVLRSGVAASAVAGPAQLTGTTTITSTATFTYQAAATGGITSVTPNSGTTLGGTVVTVNGVALGADPNSAFHSKKIDLILDIVFLQEVERTSRQFALVLQLQRSCHRRLRVSPQARDRDLQGLWPQRSCRPQPAPRHWPVATRM